MVKELKYRNLIVSGKICTGTTTLAKHLTEALGWRRIEGGEIFWKPICKDLKLEEEQTGLRPDEEDLKFDACLKEKLRKENNLILESHLAGFDAQGIPGIFKILLVCESGKGEDQVAVRIDRMVNRNGTTVEGAKAHIKEREEEDLKKWRRLYGQARPDWDPYDPSSFDLIINTYNHNQEETLKIALKALGVEK